MRDLSGRCCWCCSSCSRRLFLHPLFFIRCMCCRKNQAGQIADMCSVRSASNEPWSKSQSVPYVSLCFLAFFLSSYDAFLCSHDVLYGCSGNSASLRMCWNSTSIFSMSLLHWPAAPHVLTHYDVVYGFLMHRFAELERQLKVTTGLLRFAQNSRPTLAGAHVLCAYVVMNSTERWRGSVMRHSKRCSKTRELRMR